MPSKYVLQQRGASGLETKAEVPALENGKIDMSWLPVVGESGAAIIARGSNANGEWVRWEDGTQVCWGSKTLTISTSLNGNIYLMTVNSILFPASFISAPVCVLSADYDDLNLTWANCHAVFSGSFNMTIYTTVQKTSTQGTIRFLAIGRWK